VVADAGTRTLPSMQFLDGEFRAPFVSMFAPNSLMGDNNGPEEDDDVREEHNVLRPYQIDWWADGEWYNAGWAHYDGRGRYYEPGYYENQRQQTVPVVATKFLNLAAPVPAARNDAIFFDEQFRRIDTGDQARDRKAARYRLRYAVGVEDLSGHVLANPMADLKVPDDYRQPQPWMARGRDAFASLMGSLGANLYQMGHYEHVFLGRGGSTNVDLDPNGFPITYPLMYRWAETDPTRHIQDNPGYGIAYGDALWESYRKPEGSNGVTDSLYQSRYVKGAKDGGEILYVTGGRWQGPSGGGGWPYGTEIYQHSTVGPQLSWWNMWYSVAGAGMDDDQYNQRAVYPCTPFGRSLRRTRGYPADYQPALKKWYEGRVDTPFYINLMTAPPAVVSAVVVAYLSPKFKVFKYGSIQFQKYAGKDSLGNDTWTNLGPTMPLDSTLAANNVRYSGRDLLVDSTFDGFRAFPAPKRFKDSDSLETAADWHFSWPPPAVDGEVIKPDYYVSDFRLPHAARNPDGTVVMNAGAPVQFSHLERCYPGILWNGDSANTGEGSDNMGARVRTDSFGSGYCTYTNLPFVMMGIGNGYGRYGDLTDPLGWATVTPPPGWGSDPNDRAYKYPAGVRYTDSYWFDILSAFALSVSVTRAQWQEFPTSYRAPVNLFPPGDRDPAQFRTIRDVDRQFLAELGESIDAPGSTGPGALQAAGKIVPYTTTGSNPLFRRFVFSDTDSGTRLADQNIRTLLTNDLLHNADLSVSSADRAKVMERVLNDFRMSVFGSSPDYSDGIDPVTGAPTVGMQFRPLDFDGDGVVHCSCYADLDPSDNPGVPVDTSFPLPGHGPKPSDSMYFSVTGCFWMGKSHYYRVWSRGELWDNRLNTILNEAMLESALCVDPEGVSPRDTQVLFQRWHFDKYQGQLTHLKR
jgi:hypothetical protein